MKLVKQPITINNFTAELVGYLPEPNNWGPRKTVLICPGGGYEHVSEREGEPVALRFLAHGYNAFVLKYSVAPAVYPTALLQVAEAMSFIRQNSEQFNVASDKILIAGFSAGGHLAAHFSVSWDTLLVKEFGYQKELLQPNLLLLAYPVITSGEFAHKGSFQNLLGKAAPTTEELAPFSLEKLVSKSTPPTFLWHTTPDDVVPVENSLFFYQALRNQGIECELHIFPEGGHGLSLASPEVDTPLKEVAVWADLAFNWLNKW